MDSENMKRVGLYLDKDLVNRADDMVKQFHFKSRNEFFAEAVEYYIADYLLHSNEPAVSEKLGQVIAKYSEDNAKAISKGLFRYAVQLEMMCRVLAATNGINVFRQCRSSERYKQPPAMRVRIERSAKNSPVW